VGGTHPALVEAMGAGNLVLAFRTPENAEVLEGTGLLFESEAKLAEQLTEIVARPDAPAFEALRAGALARAASRYSWDAVTDAYLALWASLGAGQDSSP
jgi:glycosyltransferase involved in cell wall biosynthesis